MENNLQLQYMESSNEVDFLIYEVLDPTPILCTLEEGRAAKYQNKEEMETYCKRIVKCVNAHDELVETLSRIIDRIEESELQHYFPSAYKRAKESLNKVTDNSPIKS